MGFIGFVRLGSVHLKQQAEDGTKTRDRTELRRLLDESDIVALQHDSACCR